MFFKCHVIFCSWTLMKYQSCNHLKQWEVFQMNHEFLWHAKAWVQLQFSDAMIKNSQKWRTCYFFHHTKPLNGWALTPCGATHGLWSFWLQGLLRNVGVIDISVGHGLLRRFKTGFYRTVKSREKLHISTPFVTPKVIINGFPFWIAVWEHVEIPLAPGGLWFLVQEEMPKKHNFNSLNCILRSGQNEYTYTIEEMPSQEVMQ